MFVLIGTQKSTKIIGQSELTIDIFPNLLNSDVNNACHGHFMV